MMILTLADIAKYRSALSRNDEALLVLEMIEDCEGDLEDAAISLALQVGQEPNTSDNWLDGLAKRWRPTLCQPSICAAIEKDDYGVALSLLLEHTTLPIKLAVPVLLYVTQSSIHDFCRPLREQLNVAP